MKFRVYNRLALRGLIPLPWVSWEGEEFVLSISVEGIGGFITEPAFSAALYCTVPKWIPDRWVNRAVPVYNRAAERYSWVN